MYDTLYREGGFLDHGHILVGVVSVIRMGVSSLAGVVLVGVASGWLVGVVFETSWSCAVIFSGGEYGLPLESVSSTRMCVGWLTVADVRPGPLT